MTIRIPSIVSALAWSVATVGALLLAPVADAQQGPPPPSVRVAEARLMELAPVIQVPGTVISRNDARLASEVAGRLVYVAEVGTRIEAGQPVARIDDRDLALQLKENQSLVAREQNRMGFLQREAERLRKLAAENIAAKNRLDEIESELSVAINDISVAQARTFALGVQWHAEYDPHENPVNQVLFEAFGDALREAQRA